MAKSAHDQEIRRLRGQVTLEHLPDPGAVRVHLIEDGGNAMRLKVTKGFGSRTRDCRRLLIEDRQDAHFLGVSQNRERVAQGPGRRPSAVPGDHHAIEPA